jgi:hypothetical protein
MDDPDGIRQERAAPEIPSDPVRLPVTREPPYDGEPGMHDGAPEGQGTPSPDRGQPDVVEDPVEILVGMAERGEIDPWNINIIEVTDRFLLELERRRQLNLQVSGRTLFFAATLLRLKSEQILVKSCESF